MSTYLNGKQIDAAGLLTKIIQGTLDNDSSTNVAHGLTLANFRSVSVMAYDSGASKWAESGCIGLGYQLDATNVVITNGAGFNAQSYLITIRYTA